MIEQPHTMEFNMNNELKEANETRITQHEALISEIVRMADMLEKWRRNHPDTNYVVLPRTAGEVKLI